MSYKITKAKNGDVLVKMNGEDHSPPEISSMVLQKIKEDVEQKVGEKISKSVVTVPAYFSDSQREATTCIKTLDGLNINFNPIEEKPDKIFHTLLNKEQLIEYLSTVNILSRLKFYRDYGQVYRDLDKEEFFYVLEIIIKFLKDDNFLREAHVLEFDLKKKRAYYLYHKLKH